MATVEMNHLVNNQSPIEIELVTFAQNLDGYGSPLVTSVCSQRFELGTHSRESSTSALDGRGLSISVMSPLINPFSSADQGISPLSLNSVDLSDNSDSKDNNKDNNRDNKELFSDATYIQSINVPKKANHHSIRFFIDLVGLVTAAVMAFFLYKALSKR